MSQTIGPISVDPFNNFGLSSFLPAENAVINTAFASTPAFMAQPTAVNWIGIKSASLNALYPNVGSIFVTDNSLFIKTDVSRWVIINVSTYAF